MNSVLVDSCVWIDYFRHGDSKLDDAIDCLLDEDRIACCGMVELELLQGMRISEQDYLLHLFSSLNFHEIIHADFTNAGLLLNSLRVKGVTIPSSDALIASHCIRLDLPLLTTDKHYDNIEQLPRYSV